MYNAVEMACQKVCKQIRNDKSESSLVWCHPVSSNPISSNPISSNKKRKCPISSKFLINPFLVSENTSEWLMYKLTKMTPNY